MPFNLLFLTSQTGEPNDSTQTICPFFFIVLTSITTFSLFDNLLKASISFARSSGCKVARQPPIFLYSSKVYPVISVKEPPTQ